MAYAVILAGGWGERLWPMSTKDRPKQLLSLTGGGTLVGETLARIAPVAPIERALVMTGASLREKMVGELGPVPRERIIGEPVGKNTAPAIAVAAKILATEDPDAVMIVLPADHIIEDADAFRACLDLAVRAASEKGALVTLGIEPVRAETEYGYIRAGAPAGIDGVFEVDSFREKPDAVTARGYVEAGGYYWNSGMFVWRADRFLEEIDSNLPDVGRALETLRSVPGDSGFDGELADFYGAVESVSVDYGIMEKARDVLVIPSTFGWDDVGAWPALSRVWPPEEDGNTARGDVILIDSDGCIAYSEQGTVAVLGMSDVVVVRTPEATLVCPRGRARDVRKVVDRLKKREK